jgi:hypothetical protein
MDDLINKIMDEKWRHECKLFLPPKGIILNPVTLRNIPIKNLDSMSKPYRLLGMRVYESYDMEENNFKLTFD